MLGKPVYICMLFIFINAFTQQNSSGSDTAVRYKRTLADCKTANDTIAFYKANVFINIQLLKLRNDSAKSRIIRDNVIVIIDTTNKKTP